MIEGGYTNEEKAQRVIRTVEARYLARSPLLREMLEVQARYDGNVVVTPLPDVEGTPTLPKTTPLLIANAIDAVAMAASSVPPLIQSPPIDPAKLTGRRSREYARIRRQASYATWRQAHMNIMLRRAHRQFCGYASWSMIVMPGEYGPVVSLREPLGTYPDPRSAEDPSPPTDVAFVYTKSASWLRYTYPELRQENGGPIPREAQAHLEQWLMFEWMDCEETLIGLMGPNGLSVDQAQNLLSGRPWRILGAEPNLLGYVAAVVPRRVSMSRIASQVAQLVGQADLMDKLMALEIAAQEKAIFPDRYVVSAEGATARLDDPSGWKDGRTGQTNIIHDASSIGELRSQPGSGTMQLINLMSDNFQQSMGLPAQMQGQADYRLKTGRAMDQLYGIAIDPRVQEVHEVTEAAMSYINTAILDTYVAYWPRQKYHLLSGRQSSTAFVDFVPAEHFESTETAVTYAIPGANAEQLTIALAQLNKAGIMSLGTVRRLHPWVDDPEAEDSETMVEALSEAMIQGTIRALVTSTEPGFSPAMVYAARIQELIREGHDFASAARQADTEARALQAQQAPPPDALTPAAMPGLAGPPMPMAPPPPGMGAPASAAPPPGPGMNQLLAAMAAAPPAGAPPPGPPPPGLAA